MKKQDVLLGLFDYLIENCPVGVAEKVIETVMEATRTTQAEVDKWYRGMAHE